MPGPVRSTVQILIGTIIVLTLASKSLVNRLAHSSNAHAATKFRYREAERAVQENADDCCTSRIMTRSPACRIDCICCRAPPVKIGRSPLLHVDVDHFKNINDSRSHDVLCA